MSNGKVVRAGGRDLKALITRERLNDEYVGRYIDRKIAR